MRAVIYARVSSDEQADRGLSIPSQIKICRDFIERQSGVYVKEYIDEAISGLKSDRPSFLEMLSDAQEEKFDTIVVYSLSRFSRDRFDAITKKRLLRDVGVEVVSATEPIDSTTPEGKLLEGIIESINEFYSANLSRETFRGLKANAEMGFWNGGTPPFGYKRKEVIINGTKKSTYEIEEREAEVVKRIFKLANEGAGTKKICLILNGEGLRTKSGKIFTPSMVRGVLKNEAYIGNLVWNKQDKKRKGVKYKSKNLWIRKENVFPPIVEEDVFDSVQKNFEINRINHAPKSVARTHILSGLLKCGNCKSNYVYQICTRKNEGKNYKNGYYKCALKQKLGSKYCDNVVLKAELIEEETINIVLEKIYSENNIKKIFELYKKESNKRGKEEKDNKNLFATELKEVKEKINNVLKAIEKGFSENTLRERLNELKKREEDLTLKISKYDKNIEFNYSYEDIKSFTEMLQNLISQLPPEKLNSVLKLFIKEIFVYPDRCEIFYTFNFNKNRNNNEGLNSDSNNGEDLSENSLNLEIKTEGLNPLSSISNQKICRGFEWCRGTELNRRHADFQSAALPTELPRHLLSWWAKQDSNL